MIVAEVVRAVDVARGVLLDADLIIRAVGVEIVSRGDRGIFLYNDGLKVLDTAYAVEDYAAAFAKGSELTEPFNKALEELIADGTVQKIVDKYISAD